MTITKLQRTVVDALEDIKAQDIRVFNTTGLSDLFDRVVLASATSNRQTRSLANHLKEKAKEKGFPVVSTEGEDSGEWVLVDLGDMVVHIMQPAIRAYYNLEELWGAKPVNVKLGGSQAGAQESAAGRATARKATAKTAPARTAGAKKAAPKKPAVAGSAARKTASAGVGKTGAGASPRPALTALRRVRTGQS